eukprot:TRINITY_DN14984_c0_g2_i3.p2 TRINITY_DN14984_c0_g2~~TRINITY_DN14984_c0_g2_i3.p2  ORF type:complete len:106 (-),score=18.30 TRINITY_DN14984_c0_g2_i3:268-585(-)
MAGCGGYAGPPGAYGGSLPAGGSLSAAPAAGYYAASSPPQLLQAQGGGVSSRMQSWVPTPQTPLPTNYGVAPATPTQFVPAAVRGDDCGRAKVWSARWHAGSRKQ